LYLPLDRLLKSGEGASAGDTRAGGGPVSEAPAGSSTSVDGSAAATRLRDLNRGREAR
jgi:membrane protease subunit HflK